MATLKKSARKRAAAKDDNLQAQAERLSKSLGESAQQVWLGGKLFETLVKEGLSLEQTTRKLAGGRVEAVRDAVESTVGQARERATDTWDRLEKVFEERVQRALRRLEVPSREDLGALIDRVDALNGELRRLGGIPAARKAPTARAATASKTTAAKKTSRAANSAKKSSPAKTATTPAKRRSSK
jgi:poly(hydroxyalkanoate) granule-associated protein